MRKKSFSSQKGTIIDKFLQFWRFFKVKKYLGKNKVICDLGCGYEASFLIKNKINFSKGLGFDIKINPEISDEKIELKEINLNDRIPLEDDSVDVVVSLAVIEHIENYKHYFQESLRILKKGGILILTTPDEKGQFILNSLSKYGLIDRNEIMDHKRYFNKEKLASCVNKSGFSEIVIKKFQFGFNNLCIAKK